CRTPPAAPSSARPAAEPASGAGRPVFHLEHGVCPGRDDVADPQVAMDGDEIAVPLDAAEMAFQPCAHDGRPLVFDAQPQGPQPPDLAPLVMHEGGHEGVGQGGEKAAMAGAVAVGMLRPDMHAVDRRAAVARIAHIDLAQPCEEGRHGRQDDKAFGDGMGSGTTAGHGCVDDAARASLQGGRPGAGGKKRGTIFRSSLSWGDARGRKNRNKKTLQHQSRFDESDIGCPGAIYSDRNHGQRFIIAMAKLCRESQLTGAGAGREAAEVAVDTAESRLVSTMWRSAAV